ncbi:MAG TPA: hypothetical protein VL992_18530 [Tepidisphaeraceae bacterium]|nr:hypothetical protein [Tepidisphaeraceae bacterium]
MKSIYPSLFGMLALAAVALAQTPDSSQLCPYGGATTQPASAQGDASACPVASGSNSQATAAMTVHVIQGTAGGPAIKNQEVTLGLLADGQIVDQVKAELAADGTLQVKGLPVSAAIQPVVTIDYGGATFTAVGQAIDAQHLQQDVQLTVYETTTAAPDWKVEMRHIITQPTPAGVDVTDMIAIHNPSDHAWIGRQTIVLPLPPGATGVKVGGDLSQAQTTFGDGKLLVHQAILPGDSKFEIQYSVAAVNGAAQLIITEPTDVQHILVFVPRDTATVTTDGLQALDAAALGPMADKTLAFMATSLTAGQTVTVRFTSLRSHASAPTSAIAAPEQGDEAASNPAASVPDPSAPAADSSASTGSASYETKLLAVGGAVVILAGGGSVLLLKPRNSGGTSR